MFLRYNLFCLIGLGALLVSGSLEMNAQEISEAKIEAQEPIQDSSQTFKDCSKSCDVCFDIKKEARICVRGGLFFIKAFIVQKVLNYMSSDSPHVTWCESLIYCLIWELASQAEGGKSLFRESMKNY